MIIKKVWSNEELELIDRLKRIDASTTLSADAFVFKTSDELKSKINENERSRGEIVKRALDKPVYLIHFDRKDNAHFIDEVRYEGLSRNQDIKLLEVVREIDLVDVINRTNKSCILEAPAESHFITPSGKHVKRFLRLADAIYSYGALDRISYWMQPIFQNISGIVFDVWPLASIALRTQQLIGREFPFDCFKEHVDSAPMEAEYILRKLSRRIDLDKPLLFLVSISSSGQFRKSIQNICDQVIPGIATQTLSIFGFKDTPADVECMARLDFKIDWHERESCTLCDDSSSKHTYRIDSKYYFPRDYSEIPTRFKKSLLHKNNEVTPAADFIRKFGSTEGILSVHRDDPNDGVTPRHHAFYIDVLKLLEIKAFRNEYLSKLDQIENKHGAPNVILAPPHVAAKELINLAKKKWPDSEQILSHDLRNIDDNGIHAICKSKHVLVLDDVTITGSRINQYMLAIRGDISRDQGVIIETITWFPLIIRSEKNSPISDQLSNHQGWSNKIYYLYKIALPASWGDRNCPWCIEEKLWNRYCGIEFDNPDWYEARMAMLSKKKQGITSNPLLTHPFVGEESTLGSGSPLGPAGMTPMQVVFTIAHGIQLLRTETLPLGGAALFNRAVLFWSRSDDEHSDTFERYTEPLIQSAFLRVVRSDEWARNTADLAPSFLAKAVENSQLHSLIGELLIFLLSKNIRGVVSKEIEGKLLQVCGDQPITTIVSQLKSR